MDGTCGYELLNEINGLFVDGGQVEAFTANLIAINRRYKAHAGIRITDI